MRVGWGLELGTWKFCEVRGSRRGCLGGELGELGELRAGVDLGALKLGYLDALSASCMTQAQRKRELVGSRRHLIYPHHGSGLVAGMTLVCRHVEVNSFLGAKYNKQGQMSGIRDGSGPEPQVGRPGRRRGASTVTRNLRSWQSNTSQGDYDGYI